MRFASGCATPGSVDFDTLCDKVLASMPNTPASDFGNSSQIGPLVGDRGHAGEIAE
jgi:hypothetical protein